MSDQLFEVAFSGEIGDGASLDEVKAKVGKMFKADEAKLAHLFSGKRVVIKKNIDKATAAKYQVALNKAGAVCEVSVMGAAAKPAAAVAETPAAAPAAAESPAVPPAPAETPAASASAVQIETQDHGEVAPPPQTDPLGITGDEIEDLAVDIAPVGSELQDEYQEVEEPQFDLAGLEVAPVGSDLDTAKKQPEPPPPDTTGITMAEEQ